MSTMPWVILLCALWGLCGPLPACAGRVAVSEQTDGSAAQQEKVRKAREFYAQGQRFLREGNYAAANEAFGKAELVLGREAGVPVYDPLSVQPAPYAGPAQQALTGPEDAAEYYNEGVAALKKGEYKQARDAFAKALSFDPGDTGACYNLAVLYENYLGNKREALKYYLRYVNLAPDAPDATQVRSWIEQLNAEVSGE